MLWTDIVLIIILLVGFFIYFKAKRQLRQGSLHGWLKWAEPFIQVNRQSGVQSGVQRQPVQAANLSADTLSALDNLYREFMDEATSIREDMAVQIEDLRNEVTARMAALEEAVAAIEERATVPRTEHLPADGLHVPVDAVPAMAEAAAEAAAEVTAEVADESSDEPAYQPVPAAAPREQSDFRELADDETTEQRRFEILDLLVQGMSAENIAHRLNISVAEVELVFQLMQHPGR